MNSSGLKQTEEKSFSIDFNVIVKQNETDELSISLNFCQCIDKIFLYKKKKGKNQ